MTTIPDVFIIESLNPDDEGNGRFEGSSICHILRLHDKRPIYNYVRTKYQFLESIENFRASKYRYLHISAHGNPNGMSTTNQDHLSYKQMANLLSGSLQRKRLFISACSMVHARMAKEIIPATKCYSIIGPAEDIEFTSAAVFWPTIYHLMFSIDDEAMKQNNLKRHLDQAASLFNIDIRYFSKSASAPNKYKEILLKKGR